MCPPPPSLPLWPGTREGGASRRSRKVRRKTAITVPPSLPLSLPPSLAPCRRDFRSHRVFTIDPATAKDLDDALHILDLGNGIVELGVHIADVSFFVGEDTALDQEAARRCTTVYLVQKVVPMLPPLLCEQLCSLNPNVERLTFSVVWRMHKDGTLVENDTVWYGRSVIRSCCKLDYGTAQELVDRADLSDLSPSWWDPARRPIPSVSGQTCAGVQESMKLMHEVAMSRRRLRFSKDGGALALNRGKLSFKLDQDGNPAVFAPYPLRDTNRVVEEYMLLANYLVAQRLVETQGPRALIRRHPPPAPLAADELTALLRELDEGLKNFDMSSSSALHACLLHLTEAGMSEEIQQAVTVLATHPMRPAAYLAVGSHVDSPATWRHFALNIPYYTHFTSPIRRYADVLVHRLLLSSLGPSPSHSSPEREGGGGGEGEGGQGCSWSWEEIDARAKACNEKKLAAKNAQEASDRLFLSVYLRQHHGAPSLPPFLTSGMVISLGATSFTLLLPALDLEHRLHIRDISGVANSSAASSIPSSSSSSGGAGTPARITSLTLHPSPPPSLPPWTPADSLLTLRLFSKVRVAVSVKEQSMDLLVTVLGVE